MGSQLLSTVERREVLPESYIRPEFDRPRLAEVMTDSDVPLIDLASPDKQRVIDQIGLACRTYGFFQVSLPLALKDLVSKNLGFVLGCACFSVQTSAQLTQLNFFGGFREFVSPPCQTLLCMIFLISSRS